MIETLNNNDVLYSSNKDTDLPADVQREFVPADDVVFDIRSAPKPAMPVNAQPMLTAQTIIPQQRIIPEVALTEVDALRIDADKLIKTYGVVDAAGIVSDIKSGNNLSPSVAEQLVTSNIVTESKTVGGAVIKPLPSSPIKKKSNGLQIRKRTLGLIDNISDLIYNLIYWKNG